MGVELILDAPHQLEGGPRHVGEDVEATLDVQGAALDDKRAAHVARHLKHTAYRSVGVVQRGPRCVQHAYGWPGDDAWRRLDRLEGVDKGGHPCGEGGGFT